MLLKKQLSSSKTKLALILIAPLLKKHNVIIQLRSAAVLNDVDDAQSLSQELRGEIFAGEVRANQMRAPVMRAKIEGNPCLEPFTQ